MNRRLQLGLFVLGCALLALLVRDIGWRVLLRDVARTGWWLVPIVLIYLPVYCLNAAAWRLIMVEEPRPGYLRVLATTISGFALNYMTPVLALGGEPYKVAAVAPWLGARRATGTVLLYTMLHALANLLVWLGAVFVAMALLRPPAAGLALLAVIAAALLGVIAWVFARHREGVVEGFFALVERLPLVGRLARRLEPHRQTLLAIDRQIREFYYSDRRRFFLAVGIEFGARCLSMAEFWFIFISLGLHLGYLHAFMIGGFTSLMMNLLFFMPFEMGSKEGGLFALFRLAARSGASGVSTSLVSRLRELFWVVIGLLLTWTVGRPGSGRRVGSPGR